MVEMQENEETHRTTQAQQHRCQTQSLFCRLFCFGSRNQSLSLAGMEVTLQQRAGKKQTSTLAVVAVAKRLWHRVPCERLTRTQQRIWFNPVDCPVPPPPPPVPRNSQVRSSAVRAAFSWNAPVDPVVVARQVKKYVPKEPWIVKPLSLPSEGEVDLRVKCYFLVRYSSRGGREGRDEPNALSLCEVCVFLMASTSQFHSLKSLLALKLSLLNSWSHYYSCCISSAKDTRLPARGFV